MGQSSTADPPVGIETAGVRMSLDTFRAIEHNDVDDFYRYELVRGVLVVTVPRSFQDRAANEVLSYHLREFRDNHPEGYRIDTTIYSQEITTRRDTVRVADRVIWANLGRTLDPDTDAPAIAIDFVAAGRRAWMGDYETRRREYLNCGVSEYWVISRFERQMTVFRRARRPLILNGRQPYQSPQLPQFNVPLTEMLTQADRLNSAQRKRG